MEKRIETSSKNYLLNPLIMNNGKPPVYRLASKKQLLNDVKDSLDVLRGVNSPDLLSSHLRRCREHYEVSLDLNEIFLNLVSTVRGYSLGPGANILHKRDGSASLKEDCTWRSLLEMYMKAIEPSSFKNEMGNYKFKISLSAQNSIAREIFIQIQNRNIDKFLQYTPRIIKENAHTGSITRSLSISNCLSGSIGNDEIQAIEKLCKHLFLIVKNIYSYNSSTLNNKKNYSNLQREKLDEYVRLIIKKQSAILMLRGGISIRSDIKWQLVGISKEDINQILLKTNNRFWRSYKHTPMKDIIHGFFWRLEASSDLLHGLQFVILCDVDFIEKTGLGKQILEADIRKQFIKQFEEEVSNYSGSGKPTDSSRYFSVNWFSYVPHLATRLNAYGHMPLHKKKDVLDAQSQVLIKMHGKLDLKDKSQQEAFKKLVYYFTHVEDYFEFSLVPIDRVRRTNSVDGVSKEYDRKIQTFGRGQLHAKKVRKISRNKNTEQSWGNLLGKLL